MAAAASSNGQSGSLRGSFALPFRAINLHFSAGDSLIRDNGQVGSLAGAAYLLNHNAGVLSGAQLRQKRNVADKAKSSVDSDFQH